MADAQHELDFGAFALVPANPGDDAWETNTLAELDFGNPNPVVAPIQSLLQDGSLAEILSHENRDIVIRVEISGPDLAAVEDGELALMGEVNKGRNVLRWLPPDSFAHPILFDVIWSRLDYAFDDLGEVRSVRTFTITLNCAPFGRDEEVTIVEAVGTGGTPPTPVTATVDDCTSTTGWALTTSPPAGAGFTVVGPSVASGAVYGSVASTIGSLPTTWTVTLARTGLAASMATTPYLVVGARRSGTGSIVAAASLSFKVNGSAVSVMGQVGDRFWLDCSAVATVSSVEVKGSFPVTGASDVTARVFVDDVSRTNQPPFIGTGRQQFRQFVVGGSARTQGSVRVEHDTDALGDVLVYTCTANDAGGSQPPLRQYRTAGGTVTTDATTASGARSPLNAATPETFDVPASALANGTHSLMAIVKSATTGWQVVTVAASTLVGGTELGTRTNGVYIYLPTTDWTLVELGRVTLPPVALPPGSDAAVRIKLSSTGSVDLDEALIFHATNGALTWIRCGSGTPAAGGPSSRVSVDTATLDWPRPAIWLGTEADGSDSRHALGRTEVGAHGTHMLEPGVINLYTLTLGATNAAASARFFRRWMHNAAGDAA